MTKTLNASSAHQDLVELVRQAQAGSGAAADVLFERYREPLLVVIRRVMYPRLRRLYDSDDFLVDTFAEVFARQFTNDVLRSPETLWPYLKRIAENKVRDAERKYLVALRHNISHDVPLESLKSEECLWSKDLSPFEVLLLKELVEDRLTNLIDQLPHMLQRIVRLLLKGSATTTIAHRLGVEPKRVYRAMEWLRRKLVE